MSGRAMSSIYSCAECRDSYRDNATLPESDSDSDVKEVET